MHKIIILLVLFIFNLSFAGDKSHDIYFETTKSIDEMLENFMDFEGECENCSDDVYMHQIEYQRTDDHFYLWVSVSSLKDSHSFIEITIKREDETLTILQKQVDEESGEKLAKITGLKNAPLFKGVDIITILKQQDDQSSIAHHTMKLSYGIFLKPFGFFIHKAIKDACEKVKQKLLEEAPSSSEKLNLEVF